jgi:hypothetical protein
MLFCGLSDCLFAQQTPPQLPPPRLERPGGNRNLDEDGIRGNRTQSGGTTGASRNRDNDNPKFDELLGAKDLSRFRGYDGEEIGAGWKIDGKNLHFDGSGGGDIITKDEYDDFELQFEYKISEGGNSGVMFRVSLGDANADMSGPEFQILDDEKHAEGTNPLTEAGGLYGMYAPNNKKPRAAGTWNEVRMIVDGNLVTHYLNGVKVVEAEIGSQIWKNRLKDSKFKDWEKYATNSKGHIAFQDHGDEVWYRNIRVKSLSEDTNSLSNRSLGSEPRSGVRPAPIQGSTGNPARRRPRFYIEGVDADPQKGKDKDVDKKDK